MKRSTINKSIKQAIDFFTGRKFTLPPCFYWNLTKWKKYPEYKKQLNQYFLGWDVTDFGLNDFHKFGRIIATLRNTKSYAQKLMMLLPEQRSPVHYHLHKMEDIINQGGGELEIKVWPASQHDRLLDLPFKIVKDGLVLNVAGSDILTLRPGESVRIEPGVFHQFWGKLGKSPVISMEISSLNNDKTDNHWLDHQVSRYPNIIEDEPITYPLCWEKI